MKKLILSMAAAATMTLANSGTASAGSAKEERIARVRQATVQIRELEARDSSHLVTTELGNAEAWLKEADSSASKRRKRKKFARAMDRVEAMLELVDALLIEQQAQEDADQATDALELAAAKLRETTLKAQDLENRQAALEKELVQ